MLAKLLQVSGRNGQVTTAYKTAGQHVGTAFSISILSGRGSEHSLRAVPLLRSYHPRALLHSLSAHRS